MGLTKISWTERIWNPVTGCSKISPGCQNCYAERMAKRLAGRCGYPKNKPFAVTIHPDRLDEPLKWKKPSRIFVCSMGSLFHEDVPEPFIDDILDVVAGCPQHIFMVLTKRPENLQQKLYGYHPDVPCRKLGGGDYLPNLWLGVTAENQEQADKRIPILLQIPAAVRFVSVEPMLGPVDLTNVHCPGEIQPFWATTGGHQFNALQDDDDHYYDSENHLDWVICGGETGPHARPMHPDWVRSLRDQCQAAGVPFFFKQWGEWRPVAPIGRLLDGQEWDERPMGL